ncbi:MAG: histidinol dehydrogenase [Planctomycetota bacterium]
MLRILPHSEAGSAIARLSERLAIFERESSARSAELTRKVFGEALAPSRVVDRIVDAVRRRGDDAVSEYTLKLDGAILTPDLFRVDPSVALQAEKGADEGFLSAVRLAAENVRAYQEAIRVEDPPPLEEGGRVLRRRYWPVRSAACYVPGGLAPYPSTVIMSVVPAQVAGVSRVAVISPPRHGKEIDRRVLATCSVLGVQEIYRIGGVQAVAAMAVGTETIEAVDKVVGPGNLFVMLAKKAVYGHVDIDMFAGPSEILVIADASANPAWVAADLLSQAEHDEMASSVLVTDSREMAERVDQALEKQLSELSRAETARASIQRFGLAIIVADMDAAIELTNEVAPEHVEVQTANADEVAAGIRSAGAVFIGPWTPEPVGDYVAGSSHILPTGGTARFFSGLSVNTFLRATAYVKYDRKELKLAQQAIQALARAEGYDAHGRSASIREEEWDRT